MDDFYKTKMGQQFFDGTMRQIADALEGINEKMERFVAAIEASKKTNDQWLDGRVTIDAGTHMALLEAVQKLGGHFDKWFELQTKPRRFIRAIDLLPEEKELDDGRLYWSNTVGWVSIELCDAFSADEKAKLNLPLNGEWVPVGWLRHHWVIREKVHAEKEEEGAGHDMDRCARHHNHNCPDCHPMPEDAEER